MRLLQSFVLRQFRTLIRRGLSGPRPLAAVARQRRESYRMRAASRRIFPACGVDTDPLCERVCVRMPVIRKRNRVMSKIALRRGLAAVLLLLVTFVMAGA